MPLAVQYLAKPLYRGLETKGNPLQVCLPSVNPCDQSSRHRCMPSSDTNLTLPFPPPPNAIPLPIPIPLALAPPLCMCVCVCLPIGLPPESGAGGADSRRAGDATHQPGLDVGVHGRHGYGRNLSERDVAAAAAGGHVTAAGGPADTFRRYGHVCGAASHQQGGAGQRPWLEPAYDGPAGGASNVGIPPPSWAGGERRCNCPRTNRTNAHRASRHSTPHAAALCATRH